MPMCSRNLLPLVAAISFTAATLPSTAFADEYKLFVVANTPSEHFVMGDDFGDYAVNSSLISANGTTPCGTSLLQECYQVGNVITGTSFYSSILPTPTSDPNPRTPHASKPSGPNWDILNTVGSFFSGFYQAPGGTLSRGIWDGSDPVADRISGGSIDGGFASANGNVFYIDGLDNTLVVGIDLQTSPVPEPGTLSLTAAALLASAGTARRRLLQR